MPVEYVLQRLENCRDVTGFVSELSLLTKKLVPLAKRIDKPVDVGIHEEIGYSLSDIGWDKVKYVSDNFDTVQLMCYDLKRREHVLTVCIPNKFDEPTFTADLPVLFRPEIVAERKMWLQQAFAQFQEKVVLCSDLWNVLDEIDENTWVLEPERPTRSCVMRRIAFGKGASVQLDLDPLHPRAIPEYRLLGPEQGCCVSPDVNCTKSPKVVFFSDFSYKRMYWTQPFTLEFRRFTVDKPTTVIWNKICSIGC
jgi:E3 ubiquitin-protein ligase FANCL